MAEGGGSRDIEVSMKDESFIPDNVIRGKSRELLIGI